jgi:hypothetical protein
MEKAVARHAFPESESVSVSMSESAYMCLCLSVCLWLCLSLLVYVNVYMSAYCWFLCTLSWTNSNTPSIIMRLIKFSLQIRMCVVSVCVSFLPCTITFYFLCAQDEHPLDFLLKDIAGQVTDLQTTHQNILSSSSLNQIFCCYSHPQLVHVTFFPICCITCSLLHCFLVVYLY